MKYFWQSLKAVFVKDVLVELRSRQVLPMMIVQGMLIVWVLRIAAESVASSVPVIGPVALWIAFIFSGLLAQERSFSTEHENDCIYGLIVAPIDEGTIYLAKLMVNIVMLSVYELILTPIVMIAFTGYFICSTMIWRSSYLIQSRRKIHSFTKRQGLKWRQSLIVIHC